jgi:hypothetical protein
MNRLRDKEWPYVLAALAVPLLIVWMFAVVADDGKDHCYLEGTAYGPQGVSYVQVEVPREDAGAER